MERKITLTVFGADKGGQKTLDDTGKSAGGLGSKLASLGKVGVAGIAAVSTAAVAFAAKSASTFSRVGGEVNKLIRYTGATAEEASRLRFAGNQAGLGVDVMTKSLGILSKGLATTKFDKLGLDLKNADGTAKPLNTSLLTIATRFQSMPNGAEKTALAMQLFGKAGADMIPFLNRGASGIAELEKQSDKYGSTLSGKDLEAVKASTANHRLFSSAMEGLQIQVGRYVLPIMTKFTTFLATNMPTAINAVRAAMVFLTPVFTGVGTVLSLVRRGVVDFIQTWANFQDGTTSAGGFLVIEKAAIRLRVVFNDVVSWVQTNWPVVQQTVSQVMTAVAQVISATTTGIQNAWSIFGDNITSTIQRVWPPIQQVVSGVLTTVHGIIVTITSLIHGDWGNAWNGIKEIFSGVWNTMFGIVKVQFELIRLAISVALDAVGQVVKVGWGKVHDFFAGAVHGIAGVFSGLADAITAPYRAAFSEIKKLWNSTVGGFGFSTPKWIPLIGGHSFHIPKMHTGGIVGGLNSEPIMQLRSGEGVFTPEQMERLAPVGQFSAATEVHHHYHFENSGILGSRQAVIEWIRTGFDQVADRNGYEPALS